MKLSQKEKYIQEEKNDEKRTTAIEKDANRHCLVICCNVLQEQIGIKQEMIGNCLLSAATRYHITQPIDAFINSFASYCITRAVKRQEESNINKRDICKNRSYVMRQGFALILSRASSSMHSCGVIAPGRSIYEARLREINI